MAPLPEYVSDWQLARWIGGGTTAYDVRLMPEHEVLEARYVMVALNRAEREAHKAQQGKGGRKR